MIAEKRMARKAAMVGRLARIEVGVEVELAVAHLREEIDARLALGHVELGAVEGEEPLGDRLELLRVVQEGLHFLFTPEGAKRAQHARHGRRERMLRRFRHGWR